MLAAYTEATEAGASVQDVTPLVVSYDEAVDEHGAAREVYRSMLESIRELGVPWLRHRQEALSHLARAQGVTFRVNGESEPQVFPTDPVPRIITAEDWTHLDAGGRQRARAPDAFLRDIYDRREIVRDGVLPKDVLDRAPGYRSIGRQHEGGVRAHISGLDIVSDGAGSWRVLEDNLRVPSGVGYTMSNRYLAHKLLGELPHEELLDTRVVPALLAKTLASDATGGGCERDEIVILSSGRADSAWPEHEGLARGMGIDVVAPADLRFRDGSMTRRVGGRDAPVRVAYLRIDEDMLLTSDDADGLPMRFGVVEALHRGTLSLANALGNGVDDDKAVYAYVPTMIDYYLGEKPILDQVPTLLCADREACDAVLGRLDELVTKPIDGYGGIGVVTGLDASEQQLVERRREIMSNPERYIAQEVIDLSTCPTFDGDGLRPHHVDLRVFVHLREQGGRLDAVTMSTALTRVGSAGNKIVNSSSGGGSEDTWILAPRYKRPTGSLRDESVHPEHEGVR